MERYSFATFVVDDLNRDAFERCREIASLEDGDTAPLVVVGEAGTGKTHLLYAVANRVCSISASAAVAYISPGHFPSEVKQIIEDPAPVDMAEHAVLLIDGLEGFEKDAVALDGVLRIFSQNEHRVIVATSVHPGRLGWLPEGILNAIADAETISLERNLEASEAESLERRAREELEEKVQTQRAEIEALRESAIDESEDSVKTLSDRARTQSEEIEHLKGENALLRISEKETDHLRKQIQQLQDRQSRKAAAGESDVSDVTTSELIRTRSEAEALLKQAESFLEQIERNREEFTEAQREHEEQLSEIERLESVFDQTPPEGNVALESSELEEEVQRLQAELDVLRQDADSVDEQSGDRLQSVLDALEPILKSIPVSKDADSSVVDGFEKLRQAMVRLDEERNDRQNRIGELEAEAEALRDQKNEITSLLEDIRSELQSAHANHKTAESDCDAARNTAVRVEEELYAYQEATREQLETANSQLEEQEHVFTEQFDGIRQARELLLTELLQRSERLEEEQAVLERLTELLRSEVQMELKLPQKFVIAPPRSMAELKEAGELIRSYEEEAPEESPEQIDTEPETIDDAKAEEDAEDAPAVTSVDTPLEPDKTIYRPDFGSGFRVMVDEDDAENEDPSSEDPEGDGYHSRNQTA